MRLLLGVTNGEEANHDVNVKPLLYDVHHPAMAWLHAPLHLDGARNFHVTINDLPLAKPSRLVARIASLCCTHAKSITFDVRVLHLLPKKLFEHRGLTTR